MRANVYRAFALIAVGTWTAALFSPFTDSGYVSSGTGMMLAKIGWLGPLVASIAWYANIPLAWIMIRMLRGLPPPRKITLFICGIAYTVLFPLKIWDFEVTGKFISEYLSGPAVWLWLASFTIPAGIALHALMTTSGRNGEIIAGRPPTSEADSSGSSRL